MGANENILSKYISLIFQLVPKQSFGSENTGFFNQGVKIYSIAFMINILVNRKVIQFKILHHIYENEYSLRVC